jgi:hypothetical protein
VNRDKYQQLSCAESGQHDKKLGLKAKLTGWGRVAKSRTGKGISRRDRIRGTNGAQ